MRMATSMRELGSTIKGVDLVYSDYKEETCTKENGLKTSNMDRVSLPTMKVRHTRATGIKVDKSRSKASTRAQPLKSSYKLLIIGSKSSIVSPLSTLITKTGYSRLPSTQLTLTKRPRTPIS